MATPSRPAHLMLQHPAPVRLDPERRLAACNPIPGHLTTFVGRELEVADIVRLATGPVRLLTVTGPGGVGKTRLAMAAASELEARFANGVAFVPLADVSDANLVFPAIARSLGYHPGDAGDPTTTLRCYLADREMLLVLDNLEQLSLGASIAELLQATPGVTVIATSRALLRISGEQAFSVHPFEVPSPGGPITASRALGSAAVQLFVDRAKAVRPDFELNDQNAPAVVAICHRLDGLPLAIELAAARSNVLSPESLLTWMDHALPLLNRGSRDQPQRLQTLSNAIAWSYNLLTPAEQLLLQWAAVFRGGLTLAALASLERSPAFIAHGPAINLLASLVDNSLLHPVPARDAGGTERFTMLETVREFALEKLADSGNWEIAHDALLAHFVAETRGSTVPWLVSPGSEHDVAFFSRWEQDLPNVRLALEWAMERGSSATVLQLASSLFLIWWTRGPADEGQRWLERGLEGKEQPGPFERGLALLVLSALTQRQHQSELATHYARQAIVIFRDVGHIECAGISHYLLAIAQYSRGHLPAASRSYRRARRLLTNCNKVMAVEAMAGEAQVAREQGDLDRAASLYVEGLEYQVANNLAWGAALSRYGYGAVLQESGDFPEASKQYLDSLKYWQSIGDWQSLAICLEAIASARCYEGDLTAAAQLLAAGQAVRTASSTPAPLQTIHSYGGLVSMVRASLGANPFDAAWLTGLTLSPAEAITLAGSPIRPVESEHPLHDSDDEQVYGLTAREREVLRLIAAGHTDRQIAERLFISRRTASEHAGNILHKVGARSRADAAAFAVRTGLD